MTQSNSAQCFHCGLPLPAGAHYTVDIDGVTRPMCCRGCQAVAQAIMDGGLVDYYRYRTESPRNPGELIPNALKELNLYDKPELQKSFVRDSGDSVREASLILEGIVCAACVWLNERHVNALPGVIEFRVNYATHRAQLRWDDSRIHLSEILTAIAAIGYVAHPFDPGRQEALFKQERKLALRRIAVAGLGAMQVMMLAVAMYAGDYSGMQLDIRVFMRWVSLIIATPVLLYAARPFLDAAWRDLRRRQLGMDVPVALAIGAAFLASAWATVVNHGEIYFDSATMFTFFLLSGRYLEMMARHRAGLAAEELVRLLPPVATRLTGNGDEVVPVTELAPGDRVLIRPGDTVPADSRVVEGMSSIDESLLTGESLPLAKRPGDALIGGTVNVESPLTAIVEKVGADTVLSTIVRLLDRAQTEKPHIARLADRAAAWFVAALLIVAAVVAWWWWQHDAEAAFRITLSVLVVTCPCALSLATPAAVTAATGALTRLGVLTTRGHALETLARATDVIFDKTGTLTRGQLRLAEVHALRNLDDAQVLRIAAALERHSEHPVARVLVRAGEAQTSAQAVHAVPGQGLEGRVDGVLYRIGNSAFVTALSDVPSNLAEQRATEVCLGDEHGLLARFVLEDELRPEACDAIAALRKRGLRVELLSGDSPAAVEHVAARLGVTEARGAMTPADKLERLRELQRAGRTAAMVGDGVNDAPVLAGAPVSLAMGSGTQIAQASADMILLSENLGHLAAAVTMARRTLAVIRQNLTWAVVYNLIAVPLAALGHVTPWMAAIGMSASSLLVVLNALRLTRVGAPIRLAARDTRPALASPT